MHTGFVLSFVLKVMISSCQHFYDNLSFTGILNRLIFDRVYDSLILSLLLSTLGYRLSTKCSSAESTTSWHFRMVSIAESSRKKNEQCIQQRVSGSKWFCVL